jgi:hypothetical protein
MDQNKNQQPSTSKTLRAELIKKEKERAAKARIFLERLRQSANAVASTPEGRFFLRWLALRVCGFGRSKVGADSQSKTVDLASTAHNAAMENVYLKVRGLLRREHLIKIELTKMEEE